MKRLSLSVTSGFLLLATARCATTTADSVAITRNEAAVSACSRVGQVDVPPGVPDTDRNIAFARTASRAGANTVLIGSAEARVGVAYRCGTPTLAGR
ncbi:MAG: hypothetical protein ABJC07_10800 [Acidobacteriota bacterium]